VEASEDAQGEPEAAEKSNGVSGVETKVGSRKQVWGWVLTGCVVLALCGAAAFWYLHSSLPPLRVTGTNAITHDGHGGSIVGTDGARIYVNYSDSYDLSLSTLAVQGVSVSGGEIQKVPLGVGPAFLSDVSRDGSNLLVVSFSKPSAL
jgi:hypothetical protein